MNSLVHQHSGDIFIVNLYHHLVLIDKHQMSLCMRKPTIWVPTRSDTKRAVQSQKQARSLKLLIQEEEQVYNPCSENKGADQLRGYREADLRLFFRICRLLVFPCSCSNLNVSQNRDQKAQTYKSREYINMQHISLHIIMKLQYDRTPNPLVAV